MFDFTSVSQYFVAVVMLGCLVVGYIIKNSLNFIPNKFIPTILAVLGATLNAFVSGLSLESIVYGAVMGLASTGMHQAFKQFVENTKTEETETNVKE